MSDDLGRARPEKGLVLRLYVAGAAPNSTAARRSLEALAQCLGPGRAMVEIVDVLEEPARALGEGVLVTPLLVRLAPPPERRIVGDLRDAEALWRALDLPAGEADEDDGNT